MPVHCGLVTGTQSYWNRKIVRAESWARTTSFDTDNGYRMHMVEVLFLYGRTQALVMRNKEGSISSSLQSRIDSNNDFPSGTLELPEGDLIVVPGKVNIFEIIDGHCSEAFLDLTQEEAEQYIKQASLPFGIEDLKQFIAKNRKKSSTTP